MNWAVGRFGGSAVGIVGIGILLTAQPLNRLTAQDYRAQAIRILSTVPLIDGHNDIPDAIRERGGVDSVDFAVRQPKLLLQRVTEPKAGKNRMHLDIETPAVDDEVTRLEDLGARRLKTEPRAEHGIRWAIMADPEGNEFCVCDAGQPNRTST